MSIEQIFTIRRVSNGFILQFEQPIPAEDPDDLPDVALVSAVFNNKEDLLTHLETVLEIADGHNPD